jgi:hypothetical protein
MLSLRPFLQTSNSFSCISFIRDNPTVCLIVCIDILVYCVAACVEWTVDCCRLPCSQMVCSTLSQFQYANCRFPAVFRTASDCRGVIGIAARYCNVSRTTEEIVVCRTAAVCPRIRTVVRYLKSVELLHTVLVSGLLDVFLMPVALLYCTLFLTR